MLGAIWLARPRCCRDSTNCLKRPRLFHAKRVSACLGASCHVAPVQAPTVLQRAPTTLLDLRSLTPSRPPPRLRNPPHQPTPERPSLQSATRCKSAWVQSVWSTALHSRNSRSSLRHSRRSRGRLHPASRQRPRTLRARTCRWASMTALLLMHHRSRPRAASKATLRKPSLGWPQAKQIQSRRAQAKGRSAAWKSTERKLSRLHPQAVASAAQR